MSQVSLGRPEFVPGTPPGHPTAKILYVIFLYRFFLSIIMGFEIWHALYDLCCTGLEDTATSEHVCSQHVCLLEGGQTDRRHEHLRERFGAVTC